MFAGVVNLLTFKWLFRGALGGKEDEGIGRQSRNLESITLHSIAEDGESRNRKKRPEPHHPRLSAPFRTFPCLSAPKTILTKVALPGVPANSTVIEPKAKR